jgi:predicted outer membrane protein
MKRTVVISLLTSAAYLAACGGSGNTPSSQALSAEAIHADAAAAAILAPLSPADLLVAAYQDGQAEIQISQLALQRSTDSRVKAFAQRMIDDHTLLNREVVQVAGQRGISLPTAATTDQQATMTRLQSLSGMQFDQAYMDLNVMMHDKDVAQFHLQMIQATDVDIRQLAAVAYPIMKLHLASAEEIDGLVNPSAFLMTAYQDGQAEIQLGQLALQRAALGAVKAFAQRMVTDHTALNAQIAQLAQTRGVALPSGPSLSQQVDMMDLSRFSGGDFDKAYMDINVIAHAKDVSAARAEADQATDADIRTLAQNSLPVLTQHYNLAVDVDGRVQQSLLFSVAQNSLASLQLAALATLKTGGGDIGSLAQRLVNDQNGLRTQLVALAQQKNVPLPAEVSPDQAALFADLAARTGSDFDRTFVTSILAALDRQIAALASQCAQSGDADIQAFGAKLQALLQNERSAAQGITLPAAR